MMPDPKEIMEKEIRKQKTYHDLSIRKREFIEREEVWIKEGI